MHVDTNFSYKNASEFAQVKMVLETRKAAYASQMITSATQMIQCMS